LMSERPTPVVICSTLTLEGAEVTMEAIAAGAVEIITKPELGLKGFLEESATRFLNTVKSEAAARIAKLKEIRDKNPPLPKRIIPAPPTRPPVPGAAPPKLSADAVLPRAESRAMSVTTDKVIAIGTSTGGTQALEIVLHSVPRVAPGIVIVQHMPENFTAAFAQRLNEVCEIDVKEAVDGDRVLPGTAIIAHGNKHMTIKRSGAQYRVQVIDGPLVSRHRPSVDVLFRSVAREAGKNSMGVIMTGMGDDGANGLMEMKEAGARTYAQDEDTCIVFGMPAEAIARGAVDEVVSLYSISKLISNFK